MAQAQIPSGMMELIAAQQQAASTAAAPPAQQQQQQLQPPGGEAISSDAAAEAAGRGRKRSANARPADERVAAVQEKNRKAQKRFRERQKEKMSTMEQQIEQMKQEITQLREENSAVAGRNAVLEKVLTLREEQLKAYQNGDTAQGHSLAALTQHMPQLTAASSGLAALAASGALQVGAGGLQISLPTSGLSSATLAAPPAPQPPPDAGKQQQQQQAGPPAGQWLDTVRELSSLAAEPEKRPPNSEARLAQLVSQAATLCAQSAPGSRGGSGNSMAGSACDPARWQSVACNLAASQAQRQEVRALRERHLQRIAAVRGAQSDQQSLKQENRAASSPEEQAANAEFIQELFTKVLTPAQFGRAAVQSYPFFVDGNALAELLASEAPLVPGTTSLFSMPSAPSASGLGNASLTPAIAASVPLPQPHNALFASLSTPLAVPTIGSFAGAVASQSGSGGNVS